MCCIREDALSCTQGQNFEPVMLHCVLNEQNCVTDSAKVRDTGMSHHTNTAREAVKMEKPSHFRERGRIKINNDFNR